MSLKIENLRTGYGPAVISQSLTLEIPAGKITALIGPNGCGKSTLLRTLARLQPPLAGQILFDGRDSRSFKPREFARQLALLPQQHQIPEGISVRTLVSYGRNPYVNLWGSLGDADKKIVAEMLELTHTAELADRRVDELSGGQQQRVFLAMTLAQDTPYLLLDEPTTYLDLNHQVTLMSLMRTRQQQGRTVITVLHDLNQAARYCDYLVVLKAGELIAAGEPEQVLTPALLAEVFAVAAQPFSCPYSHRPMCIIENALEVRPG